MEKPYTKEQLIKSIGIIDKYLCNAKQFFDEFDGIEIPEDLEEGYSAVKTEVITMINTRKLFQKDLFENHGIIITNGWEP